MNSYNQFSRIHPPVRRTYTQPTIAAILKPWTDRDPASESLFLALQLGFEVWHPEDVLPSIRGGRRKLLQYLAELSAFALPRREIEVGDRLGSAALREKNGDGDTFRYQLLVEVPEGLNRESFLQFAMDRWFEHSGGRCEAAFPNVFGTVGDWTKVLVARAHEAYIDSAEPLAWHVPRGWGAGQLNPRQLVGNDLRIAA